MRNTLAFLAAAVIAVGVVGYHLDWYSIRVPGRRMGTRRSRWT